jgi:hypothetical protein
VSSPEQASTNQPESGSAVSSSRSIRNFIIVAFATCHAAKLLVGIIPESRRPDPIPFGLAHAYEVLTGSQQNWNMFQSIPSHHAYTARIVITGADGKERHLGPLLPGFQAYPTPENARIYLLFDFTLTQFWAAKDLRTAYLQRIDRALREEQRISTGETWCFEAQADFTRHLFHIRRDGRLSERQIRRYTLTEQDGVLVNPRSS